MEYYYKEEKLYYEVIGEGKPILILHGLGCNMELMKGCMETVFIKQGIELDEKYQRIYVDLPGMGKSTCKTELASSDYLLEILNGFVKEIILQENTTKRFLLAGESYGGYLVRGILLKYKDEADGIMLLCPVVVPNREERTLPIKNVYVKDDVFVEALSEEEKKEFLDFAVIANEEVYVRYKKEVVNAEIDEDFLKNIKEHYEFSFDVDNEIRKESFPKPSLFICGRQDVCVGYKDLWNLLEDYPRATFALIDVAGHNLQIEEPDLFNKLVENWLKRIEI